MPIMKWSNELVLEFLDLYQRYPVIWDPKHVDHKNRKKVADAWKKLESSFSSSNLTVADLKRKKDSLMAMFRQLLNKVKSSSKSGAGAKDIYKPNWFAFETMQKFLKPIYTPGETVNLKVGKRTNEKMGTNSNQGLHESSESPAPKLIKVKRLKTMQVDQTESHLSEATSVPDTIPDTISKKQAKDQCSLYGELLASKLGQLDEFRREILMNQIDNLVFQTTIKLKRRHISSPSHNPSTSFNQIVLPSQPSTANSLHSSHSTIDL